MFVIYIGLFCEASQSIACTGAAPNIRREEKTTTSNSLVFFFCDLPFIRSFPNHDSVLAFRSIIRFVSVILVVVSFLSRTTMFFCLLWSIFACIHIECSLFSDLFQYIMPNMGKTVQQLIVCSIQCKTARQHTKVSSKINSFNILNNRLNRHILLKWLV